MHKLIYPIPPFTEHYYFGKDVKKKKLGRILPQEVNSVMIEDLISSRSNLILTFSSALLVFVQSFHFCVHCPLYICHEVIASSLMYLN